MDDIYLTPGVPLQLDRPRYVRLDKRAIFRAEQDLCRLWARQVNILSLFADTNTLTLNDLAVLLHRGLLGDDPTLTLEQVQDLMDFNRLPAIFEALFAAWNAATMPAEAQEASDEAGPLSFPGVNSGPSLVGNSN